MKSILTFTRHHMITYTQHQLLRTFYMCSFKIMQRSKYIANGEQIKYSYFKTTISKLTWSGIYGYQKVPDSITRQKTLITWQTLNQVVCCRKRKNARFTSAMSSGVRPLLSTTSTFALFVTSHLTHSIYPLQHRTRQINRICTA